MKLLLDTHIWLWSLLEPAKLSRRVRSALAHSDNELWLSPVSVWELLVWCQKGRVILDEAPEVWVSRVLRAVPLTEAPLTFEVALESARIALPHRDPADRFLAATATVFGLTLVTADERLLKARGIPLLANRGA